MKTYREISFRIWTGKRMLYQDKQYLVSFIRRAVPVIIQDHGGEAFHNHESYLPNGGVIDEYLKQYIGREDIEGHKIYDGDICFNADSYYKMYEVYCDDDRWGLRNGTEDYDNGDYYRGDDIVWSKWKVVGTVCENGELLERRK